ncbi:YggS family pyridoxal phosphate-dependent enzyme [Rhodobacter sp. NTK016B]|uniref:YggS family pyridoxal phosphate-dependent enzyme n=1 Tax=Rhodobacter sp. NTK016B TaxID=2759676 RepID=UPI001A900FE4|nr:YggS family pyridoxal phosphate-dependent enzyme [Rhodobacter sp. NTK016B]MBN8293557.1 YggS family pyridoxal phosphate-dependent enzyme [Rhodobacter sp. NTK016B]
MSLKDINDRLKAAEARAGRAPGSVTLIAVSKVQPVERVRDVLAQGQRIFGENRVQEAQGRWPSLMQTHDDISLHLIGPLQSNKTRAAMEMFDAIHSVDRLKLAETIARIADEIGSCPDLFVQVNTGAESQKAGVLPDDTDTLVTQIRDLSLPLEGLMCIPPVDQDPAAHFELLQALAARNGLEGLSMGMSDDFETAIAHGATHVRVGSAIFGERVYQG